MCEECYHNMEKRIKKLNEQAKANIREYTDEELKESAKQLFESETQLISRAYKGKCLMCGHWVKHEVPNYNDCIICENCQNKFFNELKYADKDNIQSIDKLKKGFDMILDGLKDLYHIDPSNENFKDTPYRVARMMMEMNYGTNMDAAKDILTVSFPSDGEGYDGLISSNNIRVFSLCPHHLAAVDYKVSLAYVPAKNGRCIGLSKLPRVAKTLAKSMLLQEDYTKKLADLIYNTLEPLGCAVMVTGVHGCVQCRGVEMPDVATTTSALRGIFLTAPSLREEWLFTINKSK